MSTQPPKCRLCGHRHRLGDPHIWSTEGKEKPAKVATTKQKVATLKKKVATIKPKLGKKVATLDKKPVNVATSCKNVATIKQVSIRELNSGISKHFVNLPFEVTKNGKVIAKVEKP